MEVLDDVRDKKVDARRTRAGVLMLMLHVYHQRTYQHTGFQHTTIRYIYIYTCTLYYNVRPNIDGGKGMIRH